MNNAADIASKLYTNAQQIARPNPETTASRNPFVEVATDFVSALREGEETAQQGLVGKADAHSVVQALAASELAIETAITVRDKVVEAYQEILRMPV